MALSQMTGGITPPAENNVLQSFSDATAGRSLQLYYGMAMTTSAATTYVLGRDAGTSNPTSGAGGDFDITINKSTIFSGIGYVDILATVTVTGDGLSHVQARLYHYDGSTETALCAEAATPNMAVATDGNFKLPLTITKKHFKPGDILRLKCSITVGAGATATLSYDPQTAGSELKLWAPVVNLE